MTSKETPPDIFDKCAAWQVVPCLVVCSASLCLSAALCVAVNAERQAGLMMYDGNALLSDVILSLCCFLHCVLTN